MHNDAGRVESLRVLSRFRTDLYAALPARADTLFEMVDALLCRDGPVGSPVDLVLTPELRRGHGAMYDALNHGRIDLTRLRTVLAGLPLPRAADGRLVLAVDTSRSPGVTSLSVGACGRGVPCANPFQCVALWIFQCGRPGQPEISGHL